jgi:hypothetical protein
MGKQGRKKQRQKRKQQLRDDPISLNSGGANDAGDYASSTAIVNPHSAVQKLRNPDPKIRHAALVALQASVISQLHCSSRPINIKVLQAVREQVTNNDLECSAVAADCLAQYLSVTSTHKDNNTEQYKETTASWALVLLGRLDDCRKALLLASQSEEGAPQSKNQQKKREKIRKQWYAVSAPCFRALCSLIEDNGPALDRINLQKKTFVEVIFGMLSLEVVVVTTTTTTTAAAAKAPSSNDEMMTDATTEDQRTATSDAIAKELCESTSLYAARCLHSALDDNYELAEVLQHSDNCDAWKTLLSSSNTLSNTTKLHLLGCLVNLYQLSYDPDNDQSSWQEDLLLEYGIASSSDGLLFTTLFGGDDKQQQQQQQLGNELATLEMDYRAAKQLLEKQNEDQRLEEEIDAKVRERKEPAKDIARRQKKNKDAKRKDFQEKQKAKMIADAEKDNGEDDDDNDDDDMMMDDVVQEQEKQHSGKIIREQNGEEAVNEALGKWNEKIGQMQLALEIVTNLVSTWIVDDNEDCDMMGMENSNNNNNNKLRNMISTNETTAKSLLVLKNLCHYLRRGKKDSNNPTNNNKLYTNWTNERMYEDEDLSGVTPYEEQNDPIRIDIEESISKASACFTNCVLGDCINDPKPSIKMLWFHIVSEVFDKGGDLYYQNNSGNNNSNNGNSEIVVDNLTSLLVVLSQTHPKYVFDHFLQTDIIQWFKHFAVRFTKLLPMQANAVPLLNSTILAMTSCISGHDEFKTHVIKEGAELLVSDVTKEFISLLQQDVNNRQKIQIEILRTLMDWYGNDDFYPQLYNELNVSNAIILCLQSIASSSSAAAAAAAAAGVDNNDINDTDIDEEQMTILSNSERFVEYKKQMLQQQ